MFSTFNLLTYSFVNIILILFQYNPISSPVLGVYFLFFYSSLYCLFKQLLLSQSNPVLNNLLSRQKLIIALNVSSIQFQYSFIYFSNIILLLLQYNSLVFLYSSLI